MNEASAFTDFSFSFYEIRSSSSSPFSDLKIPKIWLWKHMVEKKSIIHAFMNISVSIYTRICVQSIQDLEERTTQNPFHFLVAFHGFSTCTRNP